jgi:general secretion pathway protein E
VGFAFAKRHGVLVRRVHEGIAECVYRPGARPLAMAEVRRYIGVPMKLEKVEEALSIRCCGSPTRRQRRHGSRHRRRGIHRPAAPGAGHPEQADLLESEDDAPIIR